MHQAALSGGAVPLIGPRRHGCAPGLSCPSPLDAGRKRQVNLREVVNVIRRLARASCGWRMLPTDFGPWPTVIPAFCAASSFPYPRRWVGERAFGRMTRWWRPVRGDGRHCDVSEAMIGVAMSSSAASLTHGHSQTGFKTVQLSTTNRSLAQLRQLMPPSTGKQTPVMYCASSEARNTAALATSQAVPMRPIGVAAWRAATIASALAYCPEICW